MIYAVTSVSPSPPNIPRAGDCWIIMEVIKGMEICFTDWPPGRFGRHMAQKAQDLGHEVLAVAKDEERINAPCPM